MTDHVKFPQRYSTGISQGQQRFDEFERLLLHNWSTVLANPTMWFIAYSHIPHGIRGLDRDNILNKEGPNQYAQLNSNQHNIINAMTNSRGCMLAHSVETPMIAVDAKRDQPRLGGYYGGLVSEIINEQNQLMIEFRETHSSISEFILRPWIEMVAKNGFIARPPRDSRNVKCRIWMMQLGKVGPGTDPIERKVWQFVDCAPVDVSTQRYAHDGTWNASDMFFTSNWVYSHYTVSDVQFDNMSEMYKKHVESSAIRPQPGQRTSGRVGENDGPAAEITVL